MQLNQRFLKFVPSAEYHTTTGAVVNATTGESKAATYVQTATYLSAATAAGTITDLATNFSVDKTAEAAESKLAGIFVADQYKFNMADDADGLATAADTGVTAMTIGIKDGQMSVTTGAASSLTKNTSNGTFSVGATTVYWKAKDTKADGTSVVTVSIAEIPDYS